MKFSTGVGSLHSFYAVPGWTDEIACSCMSENKEALALSFRWKARRTPATTNTKKATVCIVLYALRLIDTLAKMTTIMKRKPVEMSFGVTCMARVYSTKCWFFMSTSYSMAS